MSMTESIRQKHTLTNSISTDILKPLDNVFIDIKLKQSHQLNQQSPKLYNNRYGNNSNKKNSENE